MNYQVLARKWRPHNFTEVVGQAHVVKSLTNALQHNRLHHAYLFTGTRGVGKTTIARILAKAINCEDRQGFNPCGVCLACRELDEGRFLDLIEVDAASRTKVEDTRDLLDNAQYAPNQGRYKVYLIDEVHMLSGHSFNALLKTLEEPPPHVKFLLATTDPHKIPVTVLSRCLQFNLKCLLPNEIFTQMAFILEQENIASETAALKLLARAADGSMRDALSLLDQAIVFGNGQVTANDVMAMLGTVAVQPVEDLLAALAQSDAVAIFDKITEIANLAADFKQVLQQLLLILHRIALAQQVPSAVSDDFDAGMIATLSARFTPAEVQLYYQIGLVGQKDLDLAPDPRSGFEMLMLRMLTFKPTEIDATPAPIGPPPSSAASVKQKSGDQSVHYPEFNEPSAVVTEKSIHETALKNDANNWAEMVVAMRLGGMTRELANNCVLEAIDDHACKLLLDPGHKQLRSAVTEEKLQKALRDYYGVPLKLVINSEKAVVDTPAVQLTKEREDKQQAAVEAINSDQNIQALKEHFDARIIPGTIEPM